MSGMADAIVLTSADNVATALRPLAAGEAVRVRCGERILEIVPAEAVPLCHKISLAQIGAGDAVTKYGEPIGVALEAIGPGRHVHIHNMRSNRGRAEAAG